MAIIFVGSIYGCPTDAPPSAPARTIYPYPITSVGLIPRPSLLSPPDPPNENPPPPSHIDLVSPVAIFGCPTIAPPIIFTIRPGSIYGCPPDDMVPCGVELHEGYRSWDADGYDLTNDCSRRCGQTRWGH